MPCGGQEDRAAGQDNGVAAHDDQEHPERQGHAKIGVVRDVDKDKGRQKKCLVGQRIKDRSGLCLLAMVPGDVTVDDV